VTSNANGSSNARVLGISIPGGGDIDPTTAIFEYFPGSTITNPTTYNSGNKSSGTITASSWNQVGSIFDGANDTMYIANAGQTPVAATPTFASPVIIDVFCDGGLGISPTGQAAEIIITNTALSSTDRTNLASYLTARWGI
jgi:hypothetical protein